LYEKAPDPPVVVASNVIGVPGLAVGRSTDAVTEGCGFTSTWTTEVALLPLFSEARQVAVLRPALSYE